MKKIELKPIFIGRSKQFYIGLTILCVLLIGAIAITAIGMARIFAPAVIDDYKLVDKNGTAFLFDSIPAEDDYTEDEYTICPVGFTSPDGKYSYVIMLTFEEWENYYAEWTEVLENNPDLDPKNEDDLAELLGKKTVMLDVYENEDGEYVAFRHGDEVSNKDMLNAIHDIHADETNQLLTVAIAIALMAIAVGIVVFFGKHFTMYEKCWFLSILFISAIVAIFVPEEDMNGVSGIWIMVLYLADTFLNILCELLISKQSKWNFIVSVFVEIVEILVCIVLAYRFATMAVTLFFWLPCDIVSFINWNKKKDENETELTKVRSLKGWQEIVLIAGIVVWTVVVGWFLSGLDIVTDLFGGNDTIATVVCYLDACASAVGIVNGLAILFRFREQWIAWYICSFFELVINILAGQWVLLPLKVGYLTNTTYGYIKWSKYIKSHPEVLEEKTFL